MHYDRISAMATSATAAMASATATAVKSTAAATVEATTTAMEAATLMPSLAATVIELRMMPFVVMPFPRMVNVEVGIVVVAISPTI
jgi:hypothetical protein